VKPEKLKAIREQFCNKFVISMDDPAEIQEIVYSLLDEIERLRGALEYIATFEHVSLKSCDINVKELGEVARQALDGETA
jgi:predicted Zn-dependent peptidase